MNKTHSIRNAHILVGGDFNLPGWDWSNKVLKENAQYVDIYTRFAEIFDENYLVQIVNEPTRMDNTLDLVLTNNDTLVKRVDIIPGISDHDAVFTKVDISPRKNRQRPHQTRSSGKQTG